MLGDQFAIEYIVNGQTYWDNNGGNNYFINNSDGMFLQDGLNVSLDTYTTYLQNYSYSPSPTSFFSVVVDVRNIGYSKNVTMVYTTDNWKTTKTAALSFAQYYAIGDGVSLVNPNRFGIERWTNYMNVDSTVKTIQLAISYKVNGVEYWDNNYGKNYQIQLQKY